MLWPDEALNRANRLGKEEEEEERGLPSICNTRRSKLNSKRHFVPGPGGTTHGGRHDNAEGGRLVLGRRPCWRCLRVAKFARCFRDAKPWICKHGREGGCCCASEMNGCYKHDAKKKAV